MNENANPAPKGEMMNEGTRPLPEQQPSVVTDGGGSGHFEAVPKAKSPLWPCKLRFKYRARSYEKAGTSLAPAPEMELTDALRIKSAEFWLKLGELDQALLEIRSLPEQVQKHPSVLRIHLALVRAAQESSA